jgi:Holliday junction DNA helicase RuvA
LRIKTKELDFFPQAQRSLSETLFKRSAPIAAKRQRSNTVIGYIEGKILKKEDERVLVLANQVGYEILLPAFVMENIAARKVGDEIALYVFYQQTERQPKPILIGFNLEAEKEFFHNFISVEDIGPLKAVKALNIPVREVARAIENRDVQSLTRLKGIGARTAQKIIATLEGKMGKFALIRKEEKKEIPVAEDFSEQVYEVLVKQLGHRTADAKRMIAEALKRNREITTPEALLEEVYRGEQT